MNIGLAMTFILKNTKFPTVTWPKCFDWPTESRDTFVRISLEIYLFAAVYNNENRPIDYIFFFPLRRASVDVHTLNYTTKIIREKSASPSLCIPLDGA